MVPVREDTTALSDLRIERDPEHLAGLDLVGIFQDVTVFLVDDLPQRARAICRVRDEPQRIALLDDIGDGFRRWRSGAF